jgi:hypothetical protein
MANTTPKAATPLPVKAKLSELDASFKEMPKGKTVVVQFNPDTLKVSYSNQLEKPKGAGDQRGSQPLTFVGAGTTKMTCQLWFDATAPQPTQPDGSAEVNDVRLLTTKVSYFMEAKQDNKDKEKFISPGVRFQWGSFLFDGVMESLEESLEFFSPEGKPLRASVSITISQQKIVIFPPLGANGKAQPGTTTYKPAPAGSTIQSLAGDQWQQVANANGIANPRLLKPGTLLDLNPSLNAINNATQAFNTASNKLASNVGNINNLVNMRGNNSLVTVRGGNILSTRNVPVGVDMRPPVQINFNRRGRR